MRMRATRWTVGLLVLLVSSMLAGCGGGGGSSGTSRAACTAAGYVKDGTSQGGISGATVTIATRSVITASGGRYQISGLPTGSQVRTVSAAGYSDYADTVTLQPGANALNNVYLVEPPPPPP